MQKINFPISLFTRLRSLRWGCSLAFCMALIGQPVAGWTQSMPIPATLGVRLGIINYLDEGLSPVFINRAWAGSARAQAYTSSTCCIAIATQWKPGMTMRVEWNSDSMFYRGENDLLVRDVPVMPYEPFHDGYVWAIFLPGGEVRLQPSRSRPGAEGFLLGLPPPGEATEAQLKQFTEKTQPKQ
ncbi:DUF3304 domain-containing protein [Achromobacter sp. UMC71]|uniref:DUF3304 domain-containing protein n=1 Tax=Achromobacter sp. UMC71 TaxID=1862320 RepID=UPI0016017442|nr:DUF3304 domain-containing protein [Achromobacter sp. UMC71]